MANSPAPFEAEEQATPGIAVPYSDDDEDDGPPVVVAREGLPPSIERLMTSCPEASPHFGAGARVGGGGRPLWAGGNRDAIPPRPPPSRIQRRRGSVMVTGTHSCLQETEGEYVALAVLPPERADSDYSTPRLRCTDLYLYLRSLFCPRSLSRAATHVLWRPVAGFLWFLSLIAWQVALGLVVSAVAIYAAPRIDEAEKGRGLYDIHSEYRDVHKLLGALLGFIIGFRTNNAYNVYYEGRKIVGNLINSAREIVLETYVSIPKGALEPCFPDGTAVPGGSAKTLDEAALAEEERWLRMEAREVRRLCMLTLAFIRQDVRESRVGFLPGSGMEGRRFTQGNWYMDPCRPRMWDLLSDDELTMYYHIPTRARPGVCMGTIKRHLELIGSRLDKGVSVFYRFIAPHLQLMHVGHEAMLRIRDTPMPFPVIYVLYFSTFFFVYSTPFIYATDIVGTFLCVQLLVVGYFGLLQISDSVENPFSYTSGGFSLPLEKFCRLIHQDCLAYVQAHGEDDKSFIPAYLEDPSQPHRAVAPPFGRGVDRKASIVVMNV